MMKFLLFVAQAAFLWAIYRASVWFVAAVGLPLPGNVVGVLVLFALLSLGVVKLDHVSGAADFLLKHLVFFFIPVTVGLMNWGDVFYEHGAVLLGAIVVSSLVPFWIVGALTQHLQRRGKPCSTSS